MSFKANESFIQLVRGTALYDKRCPCGAKLRWDAWPLDWGMAVVAKVSCDRCQVAFGLKKPFPTPQDIPEIAKELNRKWDSQPRVVAFKEEAELAASIPEVENKNKKGGRL